MSDNPRVPGHPSDMPSSRQSGNASASSSTPHYSDAPSPRTPSSSNNNNPTKNIIIGAIATIVASTSVYYLTQYINNKKSDDSASNYLVTKDATTNAWKRYVTMDNLYYKSILALQDDATLTKQPDEFKKEVLKESGIFIKDAAKLAKEKNIDAALKAMMNRRIERQTEYEGLITTFCDKIVATLASKDDSVEKGKAIYQAGVNFTNSAKRMYIKGVAELKDLSSTLSQTYAQPFDPNEVMVYRDYKDIGNPEEKEEEPLDNNIAPLTKTDIKNIVGNWTDNGDLISIQQDGTMSYAMRTGAKGKGTWKIENNRLRLDELNKVINANIISYFTLTNITASSFTMKRTIKPFDTYNLLRAKSK